MRRVAATPLIVTCALWPATASAAPSPATAHGTASQVAGSAARIRLPASQVAARTPAQRPPAPQVQLRRPSPGTTCTYDPASLLTTCVTYGPIVSVAGTPGLCVYAGITGSIYNARGQVVERWAAMSALFPCR